MRKWLNPEIALGFLIATILWVGVLGWQAAYAPTEVEKQRCYEAAKKAGHKTEECKTFWERTTSDPITLFTFVLAVSTIGLWVATGALYLAGKEAVKETRRIGEAQVRAYVSIKAVVLDFDWLPGYAHPALTIVATNGGQSPARKFIWRPTIEYIYGGHRRRRDGVNWIMPPGVTIPVGPTFEDRYLIPDMSLTRFAESVTERTDKHVLIRVRIEFEFTDVFDERIADETFFAGVAALSKDPKGNPLWVVNLTPAILNDWNTPGQFQDQ